MSTSSVSDSLCDKPVIIVGGGWAGLACAITLVNHGIKVNLLESARQTGGRARAVRFKNFLKHPADGSVDNGQHIMLGAYHHTLNLFKILGHSEADILERHPLELKLYAADKSHITLKAPALPAPYHLMAALLSIRGFTISERISAIIMALKISLKNYTLQHDISVNELLKKYQQSANTIQMLWEPLCLATMNTPIHYASAQVFLTVLKNSFSNKSSDSNLLYFKNDLSQIFCKPATTFMNEYGSQVHCACKVTRLDINPTERQLQTSEQHTYEFTISTIDKSYTSHTVVLATPAYITDKLLHSKNNRTMLQSTSLLKPHSASLNYHYEPIFTIYLQYPPSIKLPSRMVGFYDTIGQWALDRSLCQQPGIIAIIISGPGKHQQMSARQLVDTVHNELSNCIADLPQWQNFAISKEKRATFSCRVNIEKQRPDNNTRIPGLFLAGDFTNTHYPATLEGAIKSGVNAAQQIINKPASK